MRTACTTTSIGSCGGLEKCSQDDCFLIFAIMDDRKKAQRSQDDCCLIVAIMGDRKKHGVQNLPSTHRTTMMMMMMPSSPLGP